MGIEEEQLGCFVATLDPAVSDVPPRAGSVRYEAIRNAALAARRGVRTTARPAGRRLVLKAIRNLPQSPTDQDQR